MMVDRRKAVTGVILSGGRSFRMGEDKAFIEIEGMPIVQRICRLFLHLFQEVIIVTNHKDRYLQFGVEVYDDLIPDLGALGGLYTAITFASFSYSFVAACDMPFLKKNVIEYLTQKRDGFDVIIPRTSDGLQPLHAIYSKKCIEPIRTVLKQNKRRIIDLFPLIHLNIVDASEFYFLDPNMESFININTPEQLALYTKMRPQE
jgi:molybdenum cofactor guanylyltransferase